MLDTIKWNEGVALNTGGISRSTAGTAGLSYIRPLNEKTYYKSVIVGTGIQTREVRYTQNYDLVTADTARSGIDKDYRISWHNFINHKFSTKHTHRSGIILHSLNSNVRMVRASLADTMADNLLSDTIRFGRGSSFLVQAYSRSQLDINQHWKVNAGVHVMYLQLTNEVSVEPRLGVK